MPPLEAKMEFLLYEAADTPRGIAIETSSPDKFKALFYKVRKRLQETVPVLRSCSLRVSPTEDSQLWIVLRPQRVEEVDVEELQL